MDWSCGQNPGRNPEGRQRAFSARDDGVSANRIHVAGPVLLPEDVLRCWGARARLSASDSRSASAAARRRRETSGRLARTILGAGGATRPDAPPTVLDNVASDRLALWRARHYHY